MPTTHNKMENHSVRCIYLMLVYFTYHQLNVVMKLKLQHLKTFKYLKAFKMYSEEHWYMFPESIENYEAPTSFDFSWIYICSLCFSYGLFNDTVSISDYIMSNGGIRKEWIRKNVERITYSLVSGTITQRKTMQICHDTLLHPSQDWN
jgi:hypothetical protein